MILVVDVNIIIAALIKNGKSRELLIDSSFILYSPDALVKSINKYREIIMEKSGLSGEDFDRLLNLILDKIIICEAIEYEDKLPVAKEIIGETDIEDVPYIALALSISNDGIWSEDIHFAKQKIIKIWKTRDIIEKVQKSD